MTIKLDENDFIVCFWNANSHEGNNFLMLLRKREGRWLIDYRFRARRDEKAFDSKDVKRFFQAKCKPGTTEAEALEVCQGLFKLTSEEFCANRICQRVNGNIDKFIEAIDKYECYHSKVEQKGVGNEGAG